MHAATREFRLFEKPSQAPVLPVEPFLIHEEFQTFLERQGLEFRLLLLAHQGQPCRKPHFPKPFNRRRKGIRYALCE